jgi:multimeric flavodoxin WrbA
MNVIAFNGSPHTAGTVHKGLITLTGELEKEHIGVEIVQVGAEPVRGCMACGKCRGVGHCVFNDDIVNQCIDKVNAADGIILASPTYYGGIAGNYKCFLDRLFYAGANLKYKAGVAICSLRRSGGIAVFQQMCNYLNLARAVIVPTIYWNAIHGNNAQEVERDGEGLCTMRAVGRNMAWLMKTLEAGSKDVPLPAEEPRVWTNFIH